jgi:aryl-alcohol dehydrogenase-like predicted oxidoreductase
MIDRRKFFGVAAGAGAGLVLSPQLLRALELQQSGKLMQRAIPSSGEMLPVISFAPRPTVKISGPGETKPAPTDVPAAKEVLKTFVDKGGKVVDVLHGGPIGENAARTAARELGIQDKFFWTTSLGVNFPVLPGYNGPPLKVTPAMVRAAMDEKLAAFKVPRIDLVMLGSGVDISTHMVVLQEMKKEGKVRYIGVHHLAFPPGASMPTFGPLDSIMRNEPIDFVATDYSVGDRRAEETILPLALERKIAFMAYFPFDRARFFNRATALPLPEWAAEFDAKTWAQFSLKYVLSHPAVIVARTGTTQAAHMLDNIGGGIGRLPNEATRKRMAALVDTLPPTPVPAPQVITQPTQAPSTPAVAVAAAIMDRYVGEYTYAAAGQTVNVRRDGDKLFMKVLGPSPEFPLVAQSETSFAVIWGGGGTLDFRVDGQGKVTGALMTWGPNRIPLEPAVKIEVPTAVLDRYAGQWKMASGAVITLRRDGTTLFAKPPGTQPEAALIVRSQTRLQDPRGPVFDFQVDASGVVTGLTLEQGNPVQRIPLTRVP